MGQGDPSRQDQAQLMRVYEFTAWSMAPPFTFRRRFSEAVE